MLKLNRPVKGNDSFVISYIFFLVIISAVPLLYKNMFPAAGGTLSIVSIAAAVILSFGIIQRWKIIKLLISLIFIAGILFEVWLIFTGEGKYLVGYIILTACHLALYLVFLFSDSMKDYLNPPGGLTPAHPHPDSWTHRDRHSWGIKIIEKQHLFTFFSIPCAAKSW